MWSSAPTNKNENSAITLIALVITIIVLLILAGLTLTFVLGENGLFGKAKQAKEETEIAQAEEDVKLRIMEAATINKGNPTKDSFIQVLKEADDQYTISLTQTAKLDNSTIKESTGLGNGDFYVTNVDKFPNVKVKISKDLVIQSSIASASTTNSNSENNNPQISNNVNNSLNEYMNEDLIRLLDESNIKIGIQDVLSKSFLNRISESETAKKSLLDNSEFRNNLSSDILSELDVSLVPELSDDTDVLCNSDYGGGWAAFKAFSENQCWCSKSGETSDIYIGYNFNSNRKNVRIIKLNNGGTQNYPAKQMKIQCSNDNSNWEDASEIYTAENSNQEIFLLNTKKDEAYQYWRVYLINSYKNDYIEINKIQFYGI